MAKKKFVFLALKTSGVYDRVFGLFLKSLKKSGLDRRLTLQRISNQEAAYGSPGLKEIGSEKFKLIKKYLDRGFDILYSDIDILFLKNPIPYLRRSIGGCDLLIQDDSYFDSESPGKISIVKNTVCSGFIYAKSNRRTSLLFDLKQPLDPVGMGKKFPKAGGLFYDQHWLDFRLTEEKSLFHVKYKKLPLELFPCGRSIYNCLIPWEKAYILHFNWSAMREKPGLMKKYWEKIRD